MWFWYLLAMGRSARQIRFITFFWPWRNLLARMVGWPVIGRWMRLVFRGDRAAYIPVGVEVNPPESLVLPTRMVQQLIEEAPFRFILHKCVCRSLEGCRNYPHEIGCLFLGEGAREITPELGREATREEALEHHRGAVARGLIPAVGRLRWDSIWLGVKRADQLITICHCCDCCCYFKIYRLLPPEISGGLRRLEGLEVEVTQACNGCGICVERCFIGAMSLKKGKAVAGEACRGCGRCAALCPQKAVRLKLKASAFRFPFRRAAGIP